VKNDDWTQRPERNAHQRFSTELGEDPQREGLMKTPDRVARMYEFLTKGYQQDIGEVMNGAVFEENTVRW